MASMVRTLRKNIYIYMPVKAKRPASQRALVPTNVKVLISLTSMETNESLPVTASVTKALTAWVNSQMRAGGYYNYVSGGKCISSLKFTKNKTVGHTASYSYITGCNAHGDDDIARKGILEVHTGAHSDPAPLIHNGVAYYVDIDVV
jgi:hypothetical protein